MKILLLHPKYWTKCKWPKGVEVRHVAIGGKVPRRHTGRVSFDGIGEVVTEEGLVDLDKAFREWKPDVFMYGIHINPEPGGRWNYRTMRNLKHVSPNTKFVQHYTDQRNSISKFVKRFIGVTDILLVTNKDKEDHKMYGNEVPTIRTFYDGVDPTEYWPKPTVPRHDCFFGGNNFWAMSREWKRKKINPAPWVAKFSGARFRDEFLHAVHRRFDLLIRGEGGWDEAGLNVKKPLFHPKYIDALRSARIVLNTVNVPRYGLLTRRFFRSIASGRLFVTEYVPGLEETFKNHKHLVYFRSLNEGLDVIRYYLDHSDEREKIARQGRAEVVKNHNWQVRLEEFVKLMRRVA